MRHRLIRPISLCFADCGGRRRGGREASQLASGAAHNRHRQAARSCGSLGKERRLVTSGSGPYYIEFRSRFSWDYGHTYIVHGRVGEAPTMPAWPASRRSATIPPPG